MAAENERIALPRDLYFETTNRCNLRCKGCILYRGNWEKDRDMSLEDLAMITDQLPELERAVLHGIGEPLLNRELPQMIEHLKRRNVFVTFNSNGILLRKKLQKDLIDAGLDELRISLDGASPEGYRSIRNSNGFNQIMKNLRSLLALQGNGHRAIPKVSLWYLGTRDNIDELPEFVRLAAGLGIKEVHLQRLVYFQEGDGYGIARVDKTLWESKGEFLELIQECQDLASQLGLEFNASGLSRPVDSVQGGAGGKMPWRECYRPFTLMYITAQGNVLPCCISPFSTDDYASIILGNVFETSIDEIWRGDRYHEFRKKHQSESPSKCCRGCGILWSL